MPSKHPGSPTELGLRPPGPRPTVGDTSPDAPGPRRPAADAVPPRCQTDRQVSRAHFRDAKAGRGDASAQPGRAPRSRQASARQRVRKGFAAPDARQLRDKRLDLGTRPEPGTRPERPRGPVAGRRRLQSSPFGVARSSLWAARSDKSRHSAVALRRRQRGGGFALLHCLGNVPSPPASFFFPPTGPMSEITQHS